MRIDIDQNIDGKA